MQRLSIGLLSVLLLALPATAQATTYVVNPSGTGDFPTIQAAINAVVNGDVIELTNGTFSGPGNRDIDFVGKAITVRSQSDMPSTCIIYPDGSVSAPFRAFIFENGEGSGSILRGVAIRNGYDRNSGGGILCNSSSPTIENCMFTGNQAGSIPYSFTGYGGAVACVGLCSPSFIDCLFLDNEADFNSTGGAVYCDAECSAEFNGCTFIRNGADAGGGVHTRTLCNISIIGCTFYDNYCGAGTGGGVYVGENCYVEFENTIIANSSLGEAVGFDPMGAADLSCCDFYGNAGGDWTGFIAGELGSNGNISEDPRFCNPGSNDLTLHSTSACAPDNSGGCGQIGAHPVACYPTTYVVHADGSGDFPTIQDAIDNTFWGDTIELSTGTFSGPGNQNVYFSEIDVTLRGDTDLPFNHRIDCGGTSRAFTFGSGSGPATVLEGLWITNASTVFGAGVNISGSSPTILDCVFSSNSASIGGAMICNQSSSTISGCSFYGNLADEGGALLSQLSPLVIENCTFYGNLGADGAAIKCSMDSVTTILNTIIAFNTDSEPVTCASGATAALTCCDVYGNTYGDWVGCIAGQDGIHGNFSADPLLCEPAALDFRLSSLSPCAPENNIVCGLIGSSPVGCSPSTYVVRPDGTGDYPTIQAAISACLDGDTILLTDGVFTGAGNRDIQIYGKAITIRSQGGDPEACVIDCEGDFADTHRGFALTWSEGPGTVIEGITITNGYMASGGGAIHMNAYVSATFRRCVISNSQSLSSCGGVNMTIGCSPTFIDCIFSGNTGAYSGAISCYQSSPTVQGCTLVGNSAASAAGGISLQSTCSPVIQNTIIAFSFQGGAMSCGPNTPMLTACDLYGNMGGDWTGNIAGQEGTNGNISEDPQFCDLIGGDYHLMDSSPCAYPMGYGLIGALGARCGWQISSIEDVNNDQGRQVRIRWDRTFHDAAGTDQEIESYTVLRRIDASQGGSKEYPAGDWDIVATVPAWGEEEYSVVCPTLCDSTIVDGLCMTAFFIRANASEPLAYFDCPVDSGYSVDNLEPQAPQGLFALYDAGAIQLTWDPNEEEDLDYYAVYRGTDPGFDPTTPIGYSTTEDFEDDNLPGPGDYWYKVTATDFSGNESDPSAAAGASFLDVTDEIVRAPSAFSLGPAVPNPFNPITEISYAIPAGATPSGVVMRVYDATGREVTTLVDAEQGPGEYRVVWDGRDCGGSDVASGVYFYRVCWNGKSQTRRMVLLK
jgi:pectin methylesterase-like acyl-CoA thioesterase